MGRCDVCFTHDIWNFSQPAERILYCPRARMIVTASPIAIALLFAPIVSARLRGWEVTRLRSI